MEDFKNTTKVPVIREEIYNKIFKKDKLNIVYSKPGVGAGAVCNIIIKLLNTKEDFTLIKAIDSKSANSTIRDLCDDVYALKRLQEKTNQKLEKPILYYIDITDTDIKMIQNIYRLFSEEIIQSLNIWVIFKTVNIKEISRFEKYKDGLFANFFEVKVIDDITYVDLFPDGCCRLFEKAILNENDKFIVDVFKNQPLNLKELYGGVICGGASSGKTSLLKNMIKQSCKNTSFSDLNIYIYDLKNSKEYDYLAKAYSQIKRVPYNKTDGIYVYIQLKYFIDEIEARQKIFKNHNVCNIENYNRISKARMPYIHIYIDDIMSAALDLQNFGLEMNKLNTVISEIITKGRATGIHLYFSTHRTTGIIDTRLFPLKIALSPYVIKDLFNDSEKIISFNPEELNLDTRNTYKCCIAQIGEQSIQKYYINEIKNSETSNL